MNESNHQDPSQNLRASIRTAAVKKQLEIEPLPTSQDYEDATAFMVELFAKNSKIYFPEDEIISSITNKTLKASDVFKRIGLEGRDEILNALQEKGIVRKFPGFYFQFLSRDSSGRIVSIYQPGIFMTIVTLIAVLPFIITLIDRLHFPLYRYQSKDEIYKEKVANQKNEMPEIKSQEIPPCSVKEIKK